MGVLRDSETMLDWWILRGTASRREDILQFHEPHAHFSFRKLAYSRCSQEKFLRVNYDWDDANREHIRRHGIAPNEVEEAFEGLRFALSTRIVDFEERYEFLGATHAGRVLRIVLTPRGTGMRPVTAFPANAKLRRFYATQQVRHASS